MKGEKQHHFVFRVYEIVWDWRTIAGFEREVRWSDGSWRRWCVEWLIEPRDLWIGVYWDRRPCRFDLYVCLLPLLPFHIRYEHGAADGGGA